MNSFLFALRRYSQVCCVCHIRPVGALGLCFVCEEQLSLRLGETSGFRRFDGIEHRYLFEWKKEDHFLSPFVYSLKGWGPEEPFESLCLWFLRHRFGKKIQKSTLVFPSKGVRDHGYLWAQALSVALGYPKTSLLLLGEGKQSLRSKQLRSHREFIRSSLGKEVVFVDDILTTGSTAKGAFKALGQPKNFAVWTIFYRPLL